MRSAFQVTSSRRILNGLLDLPNRPGPWPVVVVAHGFKGFMEWGFFPPLAELLASRGVAVVRFNFSGAGMMPGDELVTNPGAFHDDTYSREVEDLEDLLAWLEQGGLEQAGLGQGGLDRERLALLGHSRGGGVALLAAAGARAAQIRAVVTWNAISTIQRSTPEELEVWRSRGDLPVVNGRTGQVLSLGPELRAEVEGHPPKLDITAAASRISTPWLLLHGELDPTVPWVEGEQLHQAAGPACEFVTVKGGDHTFGARHPFAGPTPPLITAMNATQRFLLRALRSNG